jgi:E3 ubiquitin-protein ligase DOA10
LTDEYAVMGDEEGEERRGAVIREPEPQKCCRICYAETYDAPDMMFDYFSGELITPCRCIGSLRYVHRGCLRRWQETILFSAPPQQPADESRHTVCSVCVAPFTMSPPSRSSAARVVSTNHLVTP